MYFQIRRILVVSLIVASCLYGSVLIANEDKIVEEIDSPEIELMRLMFTYDCEKSPACKKRNDEHYGSKKVVEFKEYKEGKEQSLKVLKVKGKLREK